MEKPLIRKPVTAGLASQGMLGDLVRLVFGALLQAVALKFIVCWVKLFHWPILDRFRCDMQLGAFAGVRRGGNS